MFIESSRPLSINNWSGVPRFPDKDPGKPVSFQKTVIFLCHACIKHNWAVIAKLFQICSPSLDGRGLGGG